MILGNNVNDIQRSGIMGEKVFSFSLNKKMYDLVSTNLYSDRIGSTVREVCSNAWDAHKAAGKENVPFRVTLPTTLEPHFIVEDFGTGMPDQTAQELYSTMGMSTKENSNDMIGAFGLGSKSPFTVTDTFTVENTHDSITYYYLCFKNEKGFPSILKTGEDIIEGRENGVRVIIPVSGHKYNDYCAAMNRQLIMMDPKPIVTNLTQFSFTEAKIGISCPDGTGFILENAAEFGLDGRRVYGKMGIVLYPIDENQVSMGYYGYHKKFGYDSALILNFNIGDLDPLPSREGLTYDNEGNTAKAVMEKYNLFKEVLKKSIKEKIEAEPGPYQGWMRACRFAESTGIDLRHTGIIINGFDISSNPLKLASLQIDVNVPELLNQDGSVLKAAEVVKESYSQFMFDISYHSYRKDVMWDRHSRLSTIKVDAFGDILTEKAVYVLCDEADWRRRRARITHFINEQGGRKNIHWVEVNKLHPGDKFDFSVFIDALEKYYPGCTKNFAKFSDIVAPKREKADPKDVDELKGVTYRGPYGYHYNDFKKSMTSIVSDKTFYLTAERNTLNQYKFELSTFQDFANCLDYTIVLVRKGGMEHIETLEEDFGILEFTEFVNEKLSTVTFDEDFCSKNSAMRINDDKNLNSSTLLGVIRKLGSKDQSEETKNYFDLVRHIRRLCNLSHGTQKQESLIDKLRTTDLINIFKEEDWVKKMEIDLGGKFNIVESLFNEKYPLFQHLVRQVVGYGLGNIGILSRYMDDIDELNKLRIPKVNVVPF